MTMRLFISCLFILLAPILCGMHAPENLSLEIPPAALDGGFPHNHVGSNGVKQYDLDEGNVTSLSLVLNLATNSGSSPSEASHLRPLLSRGAA